VTKGRDFRFLVGFLCGFLHGVLENQFPALSGVKVFEDWKNTPDVLTQCCSHYFCGLTLDLSVGKFRYCCCSVHLIAIHLRYSSDPPDWLMMKAYFGT